MPIMFNSLLAQLGIDPANVVLLRHKDSRAQRRRTPYELWRNDRPRFEMYQSTQSFENQSKLSRVPFWASFVATPDGLTMFAGFYAAKHTGPIAEDRPWPHGDGVDLAGSCDNYDLQKDDRLADLEGRLFIEWGEGARAWVQRAERNDKRIEELRPEFKEPAFPGYLELTVPLSRIPAFPTNWIEILRLSKGVYVLTCPKTKEQYVGSAAGDNGFWGRWMEYVSSGHGGNVALKSREPADYQVSILEVAGSGTTYDGILAMEARWKRKLQSNEMGLNRN